MDGNHETSAYRALRKSAYRRKYEKALLFGGKRFTFSALLARTEYAYNTFRQMGVEPVSGSASACPTARICLLPFMGFRGWARLAYWRIRRLPRGNSRCRWRLPAHGG